MYFYQFLLYFYLTRNRAVDLIGPNPWPSVNNIEPSHPSWSVTFPISFFINWFLQKVSSISNWMILVCLVYETWFSCKNQYQILGKLMNNWLSHPLLLIITPQLSERVSSCVCKSHIYQWLLYIICDVCTS